MHSSRQAFTLFELVLVLIIMAIVFAFAVPRISFSSIDQAQDQVIEHLKLLQTHAMSEAHYIASPHNSRYNTYNQRQKNLHLWFKSYWQVQFHTRSLNRPYSMYSDGPTNSRSSSYSDKLDARDRCFLDPLTQKYIVANLKDVPQHCKDNRLEDVDLGKKYNIKSVSVSCPNLSRPNSRSAHVLFDYMGRPFCSSDDEGTSLDKAVFNPVDFIATDTIVITLSTKEDKRHICIEAVTGYIYKCNK